MTVDNAVRIRIHELLKEKKKTVSSVCLDGGITPSTLYSFLCGDTAHIQLNTVKQVCMGFEITLSAFFDAPYFDDYE